MSPQKQYLGGLAAIALALAAPACVNSSRGRDSGMPEVSPIDGWVAPVPAAVDVTRKHQKIDGFGASSAWTSPKISDALAEALFSPEKGIGLSLLRLRIAPTGTTSEIVTAQKAVSHGAALWAAPWSPPAEWKSNNDTENGGSLKPEFRQAWADRLAAFARQMADQGLPLKALSVQNEPGYVATWETCDWKAADLAAFIRDNLGPALRAQGLTTPLMAPESQSWGRLAEFAGAILGDSQAAGYVGVVATHAYGYGNSPAFLYTPAQTAGKPIWETEVSDPDDTDDPGMGSALRIAKMIHDHLADAEVSAWHYWWISPYAGMNAEAGNNGSLLDGGVLTRRAYALGNWSRFVRPGYVRVEATARPKSDVWVTAFTAPAPGPLVIVAVNRGTESIEQQFDITGASVTEMTPWITSADRALTADAPVPVTGNSFSTLLGPQSVTTFVQSYGTDTDAGVDGGDGG